MLGIPSSRVLRLPELHHSANTFALASLVLFVGFHSIWGPGLDGQLAFLAVRTAYKTGQTSHA